MRNLNDYAKKCMMELDDIEIEYGNIIEFKVNTRARGRWGQCKAVSGGYSIDVSAILLDERNDEQGLKNTIIHELLHSCKGCMNHGENWKQLAAKVNRVYDYNIKRCSSADEKGIREETRIKNAREIKYIVKCNECGYVYTRTKMSKLIQHPEHYRCGCCGGKLSVQN